jgi:hydrogenase expression/formation protein HypD
MKALLKNRKVKIDGFICPGHVSTIIGSSAYEFIPREFGIPCVIAGFEPLDILQSVYMLLKQIREKRKKVEIQYKRCVTEEGNPVARKVLSGVFRPSDAVWRGLGKIPLSGLVLRKEFKDFDVGQAFRLAKSSVIATSKTKGCRCGDVLCGVITPDKCGMFGRKCTPENPLGPCMVSSEGTCAAASKYRP